MRKSPAPAHTSSRSIDAKSKGSVFSHDVTWAMPSLAESTRSSHWERTVSTITQTTPPSTTMMPISAIQVARMEGTPRRRMKATSGWIAHARIRAMVTGMKTSDNCVMTSTPTATSASTASVCRLLVAARPKPRDQSPGSGRGTALSIIVSARRKSPSTRSLQLSKSRRGDQGRPRLSIQDDRR